MDSGEELLAAMSGGDEIHHAMVFCKGTLVAGRIFDTTMCCLGADAALSRERARRLAAGPDAPLDRHSDRGT